MPLRTALARVLSENSTAIVEELTEMLVVSLPTQISGEGEPDWFRTSIQANLESILHLVTYPEDLQHAEAPVGAVSLVHRYARRGLPFYDILQGYHLCELRWQQVCMEHLAKLTDDADELVSVTVELSRTVHTYLDHVCQELSGEYEVERARWVRQEESARVNSVLALLDGAVDDVTATEDALGYRLRQRHLAAIVWREGRGDGSDELQLVQRAVNRVAENLGATARPLVVARDTSIWAWLPVSNGMEVDLAAVHDALEETPDVRFALGGVHAGPEGFARSHVQATAAHEVARAAGPDGGSVVPYDEVASLVFLCTDLPRARRWVAEVLGALAVDGRRENELRHTLAVYCATHRSLVAAARELNCHKNTVRFRLQSIETLLGRSVDEIGLDLDLAVRACEWLGPKLLSP
jgi:sugar diacid utilization regulator